MSINPGLSGDVMKLWAAACLFLALLVPAAVGAQDIEHYSVYCADDRIEISLSDLEQMKVRRGSDVCQFASYTSRSSAMDFARKNFGGEGGGCAC
jgi:hypothetical protein